jgi:hypothetical protein
MNLPLLTTGTMTEGTMTEGNAVEKAFVKAHGITTEPSLAPTDSEDEGYSSIRVDDPGQIEGLLSRYDQLLHEISILDHQIQGILKELAPPVSLPA